MTTLPATRHNGQVSPKASVLKEVIGLGDLSQLSDQDKLSYYNAVCESVGLNPLTKPFEFVKLSGKLTMYATKGCADQLRKIHGVSITSLKQEVKDGCCYVQVTARTADGREDVDVGILPMGNVQGDVKANLLLKAVTKAKRRVTLSICGLGLLDETEVETIKHIAAPVKGVPLIEMEPEEHKPIDIEGKTFEEPLSQPAPVMPISVNNLFQSITEANTFAKLDAIYIDLQKAAQSKEKVFMDNVPLLWENYFMKRLEGCRKKKLPGLWQSTHEQFKLHDKEMQSETAAEIADIITTEGGIPA